MNKKIIFLDVDGTLTLPSGDVSSCVQQGIKEARENGHYVFLCTGRNKSGIHSLLDIGFDGVICSAGGYIEINGQKIFDSFLDQKDIDEAREIFARNHVMYNLEATGMTFQDDEMNKLFAKGSLDKDHTNSEMNRLLQEQKDKFNIRSLTDYEKNPIPIHKICFIAMNEKDLEEPRQLLSHKYNFIVHDIFSIDTINGEIIIKTTNKGIAVQQVVEALGLSIEDTICFGDSMNDFEMIQACHYSVVMENGSDSLKRIASKVCESVKDDGVYHEMKRLGLCK
ncbi:MAG: HAD family hydrolase [Coprobacillus sp.]